MINRIEYILKHNRVIQKIYVIVFSLFFKFIGIFIKTNSKQIIFQSLIGKSYGDSPKVLYDNIRKNENFKDYKFIWAFDKPENFTVEGAEKVKLNSLQYYIETMKSGIWISNVSIERGLKYKPKKTIYLNTWHGIPIKVIGNSQKNRNDYNYSDVDFMCSSCEFEKQIFIKDFCVKANNIVKCGMPRNDELYTIKQEDIEKYRSILNIPEGKKVILYAPTWRDSVDSGKNYQIQLPINIDYWKKELEEEYIILFRMHHLTTKMLGFEFNEFARDVSNFPDINKLMAVADILISDYSATIFDYSILERPIIAFAYDYDSYKRERGFYQNLENILPQSVCFTESEVIEHIKNMDYKLEIEKTRNIKNNYIESTGKATETCIKYLIDNKK